MDFSDNLVMKENYTFLVADDRGDVDGGERGLYSRDTRYLSRYRWRLDRPAQLLLAHSPRTDSVHLHLAVMDGATQALSVERDLTIGAARLAERLKVTNHALERQEMALGLEFAADFADLFQARGWHQAPSSAVEPILPDGRSVLAKHVAADGLEQSVALAFDPPPHELGAGAASYRLELAAGESFEVEVAVTITDPLEGAAAVIGYREWSARYPLHRARHGSHRAVLERAVSDLRGLLLFTEAGPLPAAGIPWFVTAFGRDALITASMLLPLYPEVARGTLRYLAARQGRRHDSSSGEAPGKILHEVRQGELARTGIVPFGRYYGSIDATLLFVILLAETFAVESDLEFLRELEPNLSAALGWLEADGDPDDDGFVEFSGAEPGEGLTVQSWKDSHDALSHADGTLASGAIAVSEVQGYAYAALRAAATAYRALGRDEVAAGHEERAVDLKRRFHEAFWLPELGSYALALDHDKRPLQVLASDAGQLLWTGIVPAEVAPTLAATLMSPALFSGWGIRTLGHGERRYNPLSYHNGSVWPHDTALIAAGLQRYGFEAEARALRDAVFDLAASQADLRPPELVAGYPRGDGPPVPYPVACRPQAWSAASLVYLDGLGQDRV